MSLRLEEQEEVEEFEKGVEEFREVMVERFKEKQGDGRRGWEEVNLKWLVKNLNENCLDINQSAFGEGLSEDDLDDLVDLAILSLMLWVRLKRREE